MRMTFGIVDYSFSYCSSKLIGLLNLHPGNVFLHVHVCTFNMILLCALVQQFYLLFHVEYDKLWAAVTGGRGAGRGKKKVIVKGVDPEILKYGKYWVSWENSKKTAMLPSLIQRKSSLYFQLMDFTQQIIISSLKRTSSSGTHDPPKTGQALCRRLRFFHCSTLVPCSSIQFSHLLFLTGWTLLNS